MNPIKSFLCGETYQFRKRVPRRYASIGLMQIVQLSLHTDSIEFARRKAPEVWIEMIEAQEAKLAGLETVGEDRLLAVRPYRQASAMSCWSCNTFSGGRSMKDMIVGVDLATRIFQVHGASLSPPEATIPMVERLVLH